MNFYVYLLTIKMCVKDSTRLVALFRKMGPVLSDTYHAIDYDLSGDSEVEDDLAFEYSVVSKLKEALKGNGDK